MVIVRSRKPNILKLNDVYEDDAAQKIIDKEFSTLYQNIGYLKQNSLKSFINLSPQDKLDFIERFSLKDIENMNVIKKKLKDLIKERNDNLSKVQGELSVVEELLSEKTEPKNIEFPSKTKNKDKFEEITEKNFDVCSKKQESLDKKLDFTKEKLTDTKIYNSENIFMEKELERISTELLELESQEVEVDKVKIEKLTNELEELEIAKEFFDLGEKHDELVETRNTYYNNEKNRVENEISNLSGGLWEEFSFEEATENLRDNKEFLRDMINFEDLKKKVVEISFDSIELEDTRENLEEIIEKLDQNKSLLDKLKIQNELLVCPSCETDLRLGENSSLIVYEENKVGDKNIKGVEKTIKKLKKEKREKEEKVKHLEENFEKLNFLQESISEIEEKYEDISSSSSIKEDIEYFENYISENNSKQKELEKFEKIKKNNFITHEIKNLDLEIQKIKEKLKRNTKDFSSENYDNLRDKLRDEINTEKRKEENYNLVKNKTKTLKKEKKGKG